MVYSLETGIAKYIMFTVLLTVLAIAFVAIVIRIAFELGQRSKKKK